MTSPPWRPGDAVVAQLAGRRHPGARRRAGEALGVLQPSCHVWLTSWHADYPDPGGLLPRPAAHRAALPRRRRPTRCCEAARASRHRDERMRLYRDFERLWIGAARRRGAAVVRARSSCCAARCVQDLNLNPMRVSHLELVERAAGLTAGLSETDSRTWRASVLSSTQATSGCALQERLEDPRRHAVAVQLRVGRDRRRARPLVEQRDLAERVARPERALLLAAHVDGGRAVGDDEERRGPGRPR